MEKKLSLVKVGEVCLRTPTGKIDKKMPIYKELEIYDGTTFTEKSSVNYLFDQLFPKEEKKKEESHHD